ncbi:hypothetical protein RJ639_017770 [Escallonia herrerae]|uniref:SIS domain-containing protein n=1 Tax=Escallonia herrerae TaxID=1293975 RepID=A0AA88VCL1_9ASTE|nr:hypothetical protein RJ639_017770 [Escallonia herrerae]
MEHAPISSLATHICNQISSMFVKPTTGPSPLAVMVEEISAAVIRGGKIFLYGVGREGLMLKALCMRLAHLGLPAHYVFDMPTPPISAPDLLIASAGPWSFATVDAICGGLNRTVVACCCSRLSRRSGLAVKWASAVAYIPAKTMADDGGNGGNGGGGSRQLLPMGSLYEGAMFVLFKMVVFELAVVLGQSPDAIRPATPIWSEDKQVRDYIVREIRLLHLTTHGF